MLSEGSTVVESDYMSESSSIDTGKGDEGEKI